VSGQLQCPGYFILGEITPRVIEYEAVWAPEVVSTFWKGTKSLSSAGNQNPGHPAQSLDRKLTMPSKLHTT